MKTAVNQPGVPAVEDVSVGAVFIASDHSIQHGVVDALQKLNLTQDAVRKLTDGKPRQGGDLEMGQSAAAALFRELDRLNLDLKQGAAPQMICMDEQSNGVVSGWCVPSGPAGSDYRAGTSNI